MSLEDFITNWSSCLFHFNLDPTITQPGMQCRQVASVGSIQIGGVNESHGILFPETATNDKKILEERFVEYLNDEKKLLPCAVQLNGEYNVDNVYAGVPVIIGKDGVEKIEQINLDEKEKKEFMQDRKSTRLNSSNPSRSRMQSSA